MSDPAATKPILDDEETRRESALEYTVLVVDDVPYLRELATLFLARTARVVTAAGGDEGLAAAWREKPDLILCDDCMPGMDGAALCRTIRRDPDLQRIPFVMLTSDPGAGARGAAIRAGATDVLAKPLTRLSLVDSVTRLLGRSQLRGLPRVALDVPVTVTAGEREVKGTLRNLSRGGAFVETDVPLVFADELGLRFRLPESDVMLAPSAEVVWCRNRFESQHASDGAGLRFVEIDSSSVRTLDEFIYERTAPPGAEGVFQ